jgi:hypothetical protein
MNMGIQPDISDAMEPKKLIAFASQLQSQRFVAFAGAGVSIGSPSSLPSWWMLNEWILAALYRRASNEFHLDDDYLSILLDYRNSCDSFPPDYQAQFLEECAGIHYFEALRSLDISHVNRCHSALAALAKAGRLAAIVTTNFDRLIEIALDKANVPFAIACDQDSFTRLGDELERADTDVLPVIKIHGSTEVLESLVDTRKQRLRGRSKALNKILVRLLSKYRFLYVGFSGADFEHDRRYLGIWDAANISPGFCFLYQPNKPPKQIVYELKDQYGQKAVLVEIDAAQALEHLAINSGIIPAPIPVEDDTVSTHDLVRGRIRAWADHLDRWQTVRMAAALQDAASMRVNALQILKVAVQKRDEGTPEYTLALADWVKARLRRARYDDPEMRMAIGKLVGLNHPLGPFYQFLSDGFVMGAIAVADAKLMQCLQFAQEYEAWLAGYSPTVAVDVGLLICQVASLYGELPELMPALRFACSLAQQDGDEVRLATTQAELSIRLALCGDLDEAESLFHMAMEVAKALRERRVASTAMYAYALIQEKRGHYGEALGSGLLAYKQAVQDELRLCMSRALLVQLRLACRYGGQGNVNFVQRQLSLPFKHEFWAHDLERQLYEAEFAKRCHDSCASQRLTEVANSASHAGIKWIAHEAYRLLE